MPGGKDFAEETPHRETRADISDMRTYWAFIGYFCSIYRPYFKFYPRLFESSLGNVGAIMRQSTTGKNSFLWSHVASILRTHSPPPALRLWSR